MVCLCANAVNLALFIALVSTEKSTVDFMDRDLIKKAQLGDIKSLEKLLKKYSSQIADIAKYLCSNSPQDADDVHQQTMISIFKNIKNFKSKSSFSTWFYRIALNHCWMKYRAKKQEKIISIENVLDLKHHEKARNLEIYHDFYKFFSKLPEDFRTAMLLVDLQGYSLKEASNYLGISLPALKSRLFRARKLFKKIVMEYNSK